jgi:VWFA-related protein
MALVTMDNALVVLGTLYAKKEMFAEARECWARALALNHNLNRAHEYLRKAEKAEFVFPAIKRLRVTSIALGGALAVALILVLFLGSLASIRKDRYEQAVKAVDPNLEQVRNRRKALIYVSDGYDFNPFENARAGIDPTGANVFMKRDSTVRNTTTNSDGSPSDNSMYDDPFSRQGKQFADADLVRDLAEVTRNANRANVTMYTVDPRGLVSGYDLDEQVDPTEWNDYLRKSQDSLRVIADQTGGIAVVNQNDFDKALKRIDAETSDYYVLGYYSTNSDPQKRTRRIEVKVARKDTTVWSRTSYSLRQPPASSR